jgi:hypothetical protein
MNNFSDGELEQIENVCKEVNQRLKAAIWPNKQKLFDMVVICTVQELERCNLYDFDQLVLDKIFDAVHTRFDQAFDKAAYTLIDVAECCGAVDEQICDCGSDLFLEAWYYATKDRSISDLVRLADTLRAK